MAELSHHTTEFILFLLKRKEMVSLLSKQIEMLTMRQIHIPQPKIVGPNYTIGVTQIKYQVNGQPNIAGPNRLGGPDERAPPAPHATPDVISVVVYMRSKKKIVNINSQTLKYCSIEI